MSKLVAFVGPSGVGKTSYLKKLKDTLGYETPHILTTRSYREGDGNNYKYLTEEEFLAARDSELLAEYDFYNNYYYGTPKEGINCILGSTASGCVMDLTPAGCLQIKTAFPELLVVSLLPDQPDWLVRRLIERNRDPQTEIEQRTKILDTFIAEVKELQEHVILCYESPASWDSTFTEIINFIQGGKNA